MSRSRSMLTVAWGARRGMKLLPLKLEKISPPLTLLLKIRIMQRKSYNLSSLLQFVAMVCKNRHILMIALSQATAVVATPHL